jgi:glycosyltransferase involved in cell wall biosynthesis
MKISVALCTYNGAGFLRQQLDSIAAQSRPPDELVVCDDRSTDGTVATLDDFAGSAAFPVVVRQNKQNLGSTKNFEQAIGLCTGDIIALSDQDDVWLPHKLERIMAEFDSGPRIGLVFSDAALTNDDLRPIGVRLWFSTFHRRDRREFAAGRTSEVLLQYNVVTGATMAFRSALRPVLLPIPELPEFIHDGWIALVASMCSGFRMVREPLVKYRQHPGQQLGAGLSRWKITRADRSKLAIDHRRAALARVNDLRGIFGPDFLDRMRQIAPDPERVPGPLRMAAMLDEARAGILDHIAHEEAREDLPSMRGLRLPGVIRELISGRYGRFSRGWQSAVLDLVRK